MTQTNTLRMIDDPVWTDRYNDIAEYIRSNAADGLRDTFHVGSTSIPDVDGKPELDIITVYDDFERMDAAAETLEEIGFERKHEDEETIIAVREQLPERADIVKMHLPGDERVRAQLIGRDYMRDHPEERRRYEAVKRKAVDGNPDDREGYTQSKSDFVFEMLERAKEAGYDEQLPDTI